ncbi:MAG: PilZ domain-containing protein [Candidatus Sulfotelmatobacter sp.]
METKLNVSPEDGLLTGKAVHLALPVRWSLVGQQGRGPSEMACTYDIHPHGARLLSARTVNLGDLVMVERGRNKAICQVVWAGDPESPLRGQFSVQCIEGKTPWDEELRQMQVQTEEQYQPVILDSSLNGSKRRAGRGLSGQDNCNRRRRPRFYVEGQAEVIDGVQRVEGEVQQISEYGARIAATEILRPGTDFRLMLNMFDISVAVKAQVKYLVDNLGMGVEFQQIRRGDRPLLSYVLSKLRSRRVEEFVEVEVVREPLAVAG